MWLTPLVFLWRKFPHKEKKELTREEITKRMHRRNWIIRIVAGNFNIGLGVHKIFFVEGMPDLYIGLIQVGAGLFIIFMKQVFDFVTPFLRKIIKLVEKYWPKKKDIKQEPEKINNPSLIKTYLTTNHDKICPPVAFVDDNDTEVRR